MGQEVGQVEELPGARPGLGQVALDPHQLGRLHFRRHDAAEIVEHAVAGRGAVVGLGKRAVVEPDDGIPALAAAGRNRELRAVAVANDQRAGRVEGDADDFPGVGAGIGERATRRRAGCPPDILGIVLGMSGLRAVHDDRVVGASEQIAAAVEDSGARAARADIDGTDQSAARLARRLAALPCQQVREIAHVVEDQVGLHRLECPQETGALGMRAAGEGKDAHPRLLGGGDAGRTVLDHRAVFGRHAHLARHVQEEVGRRLAARHHRGAEDMRLEGTTKAGDFQRQPDALKLARRGHATLAIDTGKRLGYPGDRLEVTAEALEDRRPHSCPNGRR